MVQIEIKRIMIKNSKLFIETDRKEHVCRANSQYFIRIGRYVRVYNPQHTSSRWYVYVTKWRTKKIVFRKKREQKTKLQKNVCITERASIYLCFFFYWKMEWKHEKNENILFLQLNELGEREKRKRRRHIECEWAQNNVFQSCIERSFFTSCLYGWGFDERKKSRQVKVYVCYARISFEAALTRKWYERNFINFIKIINGRTIVCVGSITLCALMPLYCHCVEMLVAMKRLLTLCVPKPMFVLFLSLYVDHKV